MTHDLKWSDAPPGEVRDQVGVWIVRAPAGQRLPPDGSAPDWLDAKERSRLAAIPQRSGKEAYAFAHWALRSVLGSSLGCPPRSVGFLRQPCPGLGARPADELVRDFARLWTRKEAMAKATGQGMASVLNRLDLTGQPLGWRVRQLIAPPGYEASFAVPASVHVDVIMYEDLPDPMPEAELEPV
ncbi:4'-phosphopantetheinyl transferase family protein [Streptomyces globisporus]|uniref:4'-phosphopantetheinyl transferase superfamily protein n=1 Tax=Streptomyces globisporus TaxID=1908 RepID=A0A423USH8_STRGL|nr:4'-phosphopantetheinyl transferase superfamily protein [Streptomyces globisporus]ROV65294.1 4'-phosphopantetheinyl transferase superfamily protein [Streptomyces globisporus]